MATSGIPIWVKENPNEQEIVQYSEKYKEMLDKQMVSLTRTITLPPLWAHLRALSVVDVTIKEHIEMKGTTHDQVMATIDFLMKNPMWKLHGFFRALCLTGQQHVLSQILRIDPQVYLQEQDLEEQVGSTYSKRDNILLDDPKNTSKSNLPTKVLEAIQGHKDFYSRTLMKGHLLDIKDLDMPYDMTDCYIQIIPSNEDARSSDVQPEKILSVKFGTAELKTAILFGPPGSGKSTFIRNYVYKWSKAAVGDERKDGMEWDLIVILNISTLNLTSSIAVDERIMEAIKQSLAGPEVEVIMSSLENRALKVLIVPDGLDEIRSQPMLETIVGLIERAYRGKLAFTVLATCRTGLCPRPLKESFFDRRMKIEGFTVSQGVEYVRRYYSEIRSPDDSSVFDYIANSGGKLDHILTNPLQTHILSVVTSDGTLRLRKGQTLGLQDLLHSMEESMIRRQLEKDEEIKEDERGEINIGEQTQKFYNLSLYALLKDIRTFDQDLLAQFEIMERNPCFTFMKRKSIYGKGYQKKFEWSFTHETFFEYLATCGLRTLPQDRLSYCLLCLCQNPKFRNTQQILFSALGEDPQHLQTLLDMVRATLVLQGNLSTTEYLEDLREKAAQLVDPANDPLQVLVPGGSTGGVQQAAKAASRLFEEIKSCFEDDTEKFDKFTCFSESLAHDEFTMSHIFECIGEVAEEHRTMLVTQSVGCLLPSTRADYYGYHTHHATGGTHWSQVSESKHNVTVYAWTPMDVGEVVRAHGQPRPREAICDLPLDKRDKFIEKMTREKKQGHIKVTDQPGTTAPHIIWLNIWLPLLGTFSNMRIRPHSYLGRRAPSDSFSQDNWSEMFSVVGECWQVRADYLCVCLDDKDAVPAMGLLDALLLPRTQRHLRAVLVGRPAPRPAVTVRLLRGNVSGGALGAWARRYTQQQGVTVELCDLTCHFTDPGSQERQVADIIDLRHGGLRLFNPLSVFKPEYEPHVGSQGQLKWYPTSKLSVISGFSPQLLQGVKTGSGQGRGDYYLSQRHLLETYSDRTTHSCPSPLTGPASRLQSPRSPLQHVSPSPFPGTHLFHDEMQAYTPLPDEY